MGLGKTILAKIVDAKTPMIPVSNTPIKSNKPSDDCKKTAKMNVRLLRRSRSAKDLFCDFQNSTGLPYLNGFDQIIGTLDLAGLFN